MKGSKGTGLALDYTERKFAKKKYSFCLFEDVRIPAGGAETVWSPSSPLDTAEAVVVLLLVVVVVVVVVVVIVSRLELSDPGGHVLAPGHLLLPHPQPQNLTSPLTNRHICTCKISLRRTILVPISAQKISRTSRFVQEKRESQTDVCAARAPTAN